MENNKKKNKKKYDPLARAGKKPAGKQYAGTARGDARGVDIYRG